MHGHDSTSRQNSRCRICPRQLSARFQASRQICAAARSLIMAHGQHHRLHDTSATHGRISPAPFTIRRQHAAPLRITAAIRQQQAPARCIQQAGKRAMLALGSAAVVLSSAVGMPTCKLQACMMWHVRTPRAEASANVGDRRPDAVDGSAGAGLATEEVADFAASGFIFRDTVHIIEQEDPQGGFRCASTLRSSAGMSHSHVHALSAVYVPNLCAVSASQCKA